MPLIFRLVFDDGGFELGDRTLGLFDGGPVRLNPCPGRFDLFLYGLDITAGLVELGARLRQGSREGSGVDLK